MTTLYTISPLSEENAREITNWRYDPPFDLYDLAPQYLSGFINPEYYYHQVLNEKGNLVGYCCYGLDAQVPGGEYLVNTPEVLDIGVGMKPNLTGAGRGHEFVSAILKYASERFNPARFRVTVADFNHRSLRTFRKHGFKESHYFIRELAEIPFTQLEREIEEENK